MKKNILLLFLLLSSCASYKWKEVYILYGIQELPHDKHLFYGDNEYYKLGEYNSEKKCKDDLIKTKSYMDAKCIKAYR